MVGGGGHGHMMMKERLKPQAVGRTLRRFLGYFGRYWPMLLLAIALVVAATWTSVTIPDLTGQIVDCFLTPASTGSFAQLAQAGGGAAQAADTRWLLADPSTLSGTRRIVATLYPSPAIQPT